MKNITVCGYIRVSTGVQAEKGYGLQTQEQAIKKYCQEKGYRLFHIYRDEGISGTDESRPGLTDMLASISSVGGITGIVVMNTSRLWRDDATKVFVRKRLTKLGIAIYSIEQPNYNVDTKDPSEFLFNGMLELLDQYERMEIILKLDKGRKTKAYGGSKASGTAPIGYRWFNKSIVLDEYYSPLISGIFYKYLEFASLNKLKAYMDSQGFITPQGNLFSRQTLSNILSNEFYAGVVKHGTLTITGTHQPIINKILFGRVQALLKRNNKKPIYRNP